MSSATLMRIDGPVSDQDIQQISKHRMEVGKGFARTRMLQCSFFRGLELRFLEVRRDDDAVNARSSKVLLITRLSA